MFLNNFIASMNGPVFLFFYAIWIIVGLCFFSVKAKSVNRNRDGLLFSGSLSPKEVALLHRGKKGLGDFLLFNLFARNILLIESTKGKHKKVRQNPPIFEQYQSQLSDEEIEIYDYFRTYKNVPTTFNLIDPLCEKMESFLIQQGFVKSEAHYRKLRILRNVGLFYLLSLGGYKLTVALMKGYTNVLFLISMMIISSLWMLGIFYAEMKRNPKMKPVGSLTQYGKKQLSVISINMQNLLTQKINKMKEREDYGQLFLLMMFSGVTVLPFLFPYLEAMFPAYIMNIQNPIAGGGDDSGSSGSSHSSSSSGSSGYSSDSSSGGGDSGGGDGGGGGCSSGCGGCGD